jgi:hypothetical protein
MWLDPQFWSHCFKDTFAKQIDTFWNAVVNRVLPTLDHIAEEAEKVAEHVYQRLGNDPASEFTDMSDIAESAQDAGIAYYDLMSGMKQNFLNIATVGLHHLFEQQLLVFHRRQVLGPNQEDDVRLLEVKEMKGCLAEAGIDIEGLSSWPKIDELRLVANAVKHGEGSSARQLRNRRRDLFVHPSVRKEGPFGDHPQQRIYMPMSGVEVFVTVKDFGEYRDAILMFWDEFGTLILANGGPK